MKLSFKNMWEKRCNKGWWIIILACEYLKGGTYNHNLLDREFHFTILNFDFYITWNARPKFGDNLL